MGLVRKHRNIVSICVSLVGSAEMEFMPNGRTAVKGSEANNEVKTKKLGNG